MISSVSREFETLDAAGVHTALAHRDTDGNPYRVYKQNE